MHCYSQKNLNENIIQPVSFDEFFFWQMIDKENWNRSKEFWYSDKQKQHYMCVH